MVLRLSALFVVVVTLALWFFGGMNRGWTKTSVAVEHYEEVTERKYVKWEKRFLPGIEFLAGGLLAGALCFGASFAFKPAAASSNPDSDPIT
jgi:hypothetical protein